MCITMYTEYGSNSVFKFITIFTTCTCSKKLIASLLQIKMFLRMGSFNLYSSVLLNGHTWVSETSRSVIQANLSRGLGNSEGPFKNC